MKILLLDWTHNQMGLEPLAKALTTYAELKPFSNTTHTAELVLTHTLGCATALQLLTEGTISTRSLVLIEPGPWLSTPKLMEGLYKYSPSHLRELYLNHIQTHDPADATRAEFLDTMTLSLDGIGTLQKLMNPDSTNTLVKAASLPIQTTVFLAGHTPSTTATSYRFRETGLKTRLGAQCMHLNSPGISQCLRDTDALLSAISTCILQSSTDVVANPVRSH